MLLSLATVPIYLAGRGHLSPERWIDQGCILSPAIGQHRNFFIRTRSGSGLFLKQIRTATPELIAAQENEAMILAAFERLDCWSVQRSVTPRLIDHDQSRHVLLIEYFDGNSFYEDYLSVSSAEDAQRMTRLSSTAGKLLARFHDAGRHAVSDLEHPHLATTLPVAVSLQPADPDFHSKLSPACRQIMESIQADRLFLQQLQANQTLWQSETVIHGDLKWDNLVVTDDADAEIKLVDWELATFGDPAWDVAGVLHSYMVHGIDQSQTSTPVDITHPQLDAEAFLASYAQHASNPCDDQFAARVQRLCAARIIQTTFEREYQSTSVSPACAQLIAMSRSILCP